MAKIKTKGKKTANLAEYVGRVGAMDLEGMTFEVLIKGYKNTYGRNRFLVSPKNGKGEKWSENVSLVGARA